MNSRLRDGSLPRHLFAWILGIKPSKFFDKLPAALVINFRGHNFDFDELIAAGNPFAAQPQPCTARSARRHGDCQARAVQGWTSTLVPRIASVTEMGTSRMTWLPSRRK